MGVAVEELDAKSARAAIPDLAVVLADCVAGGASVGFMDDFGLAEAAAFFKGIFETAIEPGELLTEIQVPKPARPSAWSFQKFTKRKIDWAIVGVAVQGSSVALINMGLTPLRASAVEAALASGASSADAAALAAEGTSAGTDIHASKAYREHLARVLVRRALEEAAARP